MHLLKIEEYNFTHGEHFNNVTGEYHSLNPHTLGRPLTHDEMDYNLLYQKQTINGYRVVGSNTDLTLAFADLNMVLQFSQISNQDADWTRYSGAGLFNGQFVWVPTAIGAPATTTTTTTAAPTTTTTTTAAPTTTTSTTTTTTTVAPAVYSSLTATPSPADEGQNIIINLSGTNIPNGRTVGWTITGVDANDISGALTGTFAMNSNQAEYIITVTEDLITEGTETLTLTCAANDNAGTTCGLSVAININDTSLTPVTTTTTTTSTTTTTTAAPGYSWAPYGNPNNENNGIGYWTTNDEGTTYQWQLAQASGTGTIPAGQQIWWRVDSIAISGQPASPSDFYGGVFPTGNFVTQTAGTVGDADTVALWSVTIEPDMTTEPVEQYDMKLYTDSTYTTELELHGIAQNYVRVNINDTSQTPTTTTTTTTTTAAPIPTFALSNNGPKNEGGNLVWTLTTTNVPNDTIVPFTLSGTAAPQLDYSNNQPFEFDVQNNTATYTVTAFADNLTESGAETVILTLAANDSAGNDTGSIASTAVINDTSLTPTTTTTTTTSTTTTSTTTTTTAAPAEKIHWLHWSSNPGYPTGSSLIVAPTAEGWRLNDNTYTLNFDLIWDDMVANQGTQFNVPVIEEYTPSGSTLTQSSIPNGTIGFDSIGAANRYYIAIPQSMSGDPSSTALFQLPDSSNADIVFSGRLAFQISGVDYWLYDVGLTASADALNLNLKNA